MNSKNEALQHEAGDRNYVLACQFQAAIQEHRLISERPDLAAQTQAIAEQLGALYQAIWNE